MMRNSDWLEQLLNEDDRFGWSESEKKGLKACIDELRENEIVMDGDVLRELLNKLQAFGEMK